MLPAQVATALERFAAAARAQGASTVLVAIQREWDLTDRAGFGPVCRVRLIAYARGRLEACDLPGDDLDAEAVVAALAARGFRVARCARNRA